MLIVDPAKRATVSLLMEHPWLKTQQSAAQQKNLSTSGEMKKSQASLRKLKTAFMMAQFAVKD